MPKPHRRFSGLRTRSILWKLLEGNPDVDEVYWEGGQVLYVKLRSTNELWEIDLRQAGEGRSTPRALR